jgi:hypothetical protein
VAPRSSVRFKSLYRTAANDPSEVLRRVLDAESMTKIGPTRLGGAAVTQFRGTLPWATLSRVGTAQVAKNLDAVVGQIGSDALACDVWLDTHGRVVRVDFGFDHKSQGLVITASTEFSGFGKPFDLVRPQQIERGRGDLSGPVLG